jgi:hypothetical protein
MGIKTAEQLESAISSSIGGDKNATWDIAIYKLYNYYMQMHIKHGSDTDIKNVELFKKLEAEHPSLHKEIESIIDYKLKAMETDF